MLRVFRRCHCGVLWCSDACEEVNVDKVVEDEEDEAADESENFECLGCYQLGSDLKRGNNTFYKISMFGM